jgi:hypothetical protein
MSDEHDGLSPEARAEKAARDAAAEALEEAIRREKALFDKARAEEDAAERRRAERRTRRHSKAKEPAAVPLRDPLRDATMPRPAIRRGKIESPEDAWELLAKLAGWGATGTLSTDQGLALVFDGGDAVLRISPGASAEELREKLESGEAARDPGLRDGLAELERPAEL